MPTQRPIAFDDLRNAVNNATAEANNLFANREALRRYYHAQKAYEDCKASAPANDPFLNKTCPNQRAAYHHATDALTETITGKTEDYV